MRSCSTPGGYIEAAGNTIRARSSSIVFSGNVPMLTYSLFADTVQKQYTAGPLTIVRWAHIINCHVFPGPAIITALASAAANSIATFNSKVTTSISASPSQSYLDSSDEVPSPSFSASRIDEVDEEDYVDIDGSKPSSDDEEEVEEEEQQREDPGRLRHGSATSISSNADRSGRKPSVVSVSTTISTKTETLSPQPAPARDPSNPNSSDSDSDDTSADREKHLQRLGEPPMARALLLLAEMSSAGNLLTGEYTSKCVDMARQQADFVMGFIAQRSLNSQPNDNFVTMTPGVQIGKSGDDKGQQYNTPEKVVKEAGADIIIVGRGITEASDRAAAAETYRQRGWKAYEDRVRGN